MRLLLAGGLLVAASGCPDEDPWERLNDEGDCFTVVVSPDAGGDDDDSAGDDDDSAGDDDDSAAEPEDEPDVGTIDLHARAGFFDIETIGEATITPTAGPAGTRFDLTAILADTGTEEGNPVDVVTRVTVQVDNGSITVNEFDFREVPGSERRWTIEVQAGGTPETRRTDSLCLALYAEI